MAAETRQFRRLHRDLPARPDAGRAPETRRLDRDDYPLVEIVHDPILDGYWLYLHETADGAENPPRFVPTGNVIEHVCITMLASHYARCTPPTAQPPTRTAHVFTAKDYINR